MKIIMFYSLRFRLFFRRLVNFVWFSKYCTSLQHNSLLGPQLHLNPAYKTSLNRFHTKNILIHSRNILSPQKNTPSAPSVFSSNPSPEFVVAISVPNSIEILHVSAQAHLCRCSPLFCPPEPMKPTANLLFTSLCLIKPLKLLNTWI